MAVTTLDEGVRDIIRRAYEQRWPGAHTVRFPPSASSRLWRSEPDNVVRRRGYSTTSWTVCDDDSWCWILRELTTLDGPSRRRGSVTRGVTGEIVVDLPRGTVPDVDAALRGLVALADAHRLRLES